jgi:hypothetical protein
MKAISRRGFLTGVGTLGGVSAFAELTGHAPTEDEKSEHEESEHARPRPPFDIRDLVPDAEIDERSTQCIYDTVNLTILLTADVPFQDLFTLPLTVLIPRVLPRIREAARFGLIDHPNRVERLARKLLSQAPDLLTVGDLFVRARTEIPLETLRTVAALRREGIRIPLPVSDGLTGVSQERSDALRGLLVAAPQLTFKDLFVVSHEEAGPSVVSAIRAATTAGLFAWFKNDRCCIIKFGDEDRCVPHDGTWCNLTPTRGCALKADCCPPPTPNDCQREAT